MADAVPAPVPGASDASDAPGATGVPDAAPADVTLRELEWTDLPTLAALEQQLFADDAWSPQTWWSELAARPRREYVVALDASGAVAGYAGLDLAGDTADVMTVATAPTHQGRGVGGLLLGELLRRARAHGVEAVLLEVRADNDAARHLYDRAGFEVISVRRRYYQPGDVDALVMRLLVTKGEA